MRLLSRRSRGRWPRLLLVTTVFTLLSTGLAIPGPAKPKLMMRALAMVQPGDAAAAGWTKTLTPEIPAELVALEWEGKHEGAVDVRVRRSGTWSPWATLEGNPDEGPDRSSPEYRGTTTAGPAWTGKGVERIQLRVSEGRLSGLKLHLIHSPPTPKPAVPMASASPGPPGIITRSQWGANEGIRNTAPDCERNPEYTPSVRNAFVHHTVNVNSYSAEEADDLIRGIYQFHVANNRWCDIGYNFVVDRFGRVFEGRYGGVDRGVIGAHAGGFNSYSTGVALLGEFSSERPSAAAMTGLRDLLAWKLNLHGVDPGSSLTVTSSGSTKFPAGTPVPLPTIAGHRDVSETACPGAQLYNPLPQLRTDVQRAILASPPYPLPGWAPASGQPRVLALNAFGGLQPAGSQAAVAHAAYWPDFPIARGAIGQGNGGWVVDGWGGLHSFGGAPPLSGAGYWPNQDIVRGMTRAGLPNGGYKLDWWGGIHAFGSAPPLAGTGYWPGRDVARAIALTNNGLGGYVLEAWGGLHPVGVATPISTTAYWPGQDVARGLALRPDGRSGYVLDSFGALHPFGGAPPLAVTRYVQRDEMRGLVLTPDGRGGYVEDINGFVWPVGNAPFLKHSGTWTGAGIGRGIVLMSGEAL